MVRDEQIPFSHISDCVAGIDCASTRFLKLGRTPGEVPPSYQNWAEEMIGFLEALELKMVDLFGFSMGARAGKIVAMQ